MISYLHQYASSPVSSHHANLLIADFALLAVLLSCDLTGVLTVECLGGAEAICVRTHGPQQTGDGDCEGSSTDCLS